jgi:hypothetical protein
MADAKPDMTEELILVLQWIGTSLEKIVDINMVQLSMQDEHTAKFVEYTHQRNIFMSELTQNELDALHAAFVESQEPKDETD